MTKILVSVVIILFILTGVFYLQKAPGDQLIPYKGPIDKVTVGKQVEYGTLFVVAKEKGYFIKNGLDVEIKEYPSGAPAFQALLAGELDMTNAAEFVGVRNSFDNQDFKIISSIGTTTAAWEIVARKDHKITKIADLRGKKIGVPGKTLGEFFLGNFLILNQLDSRQVQIIDLVPEDLTHALLAGNIDAAMIFEPHAFTLKEKLGANAISWSGQSGRHNYIVLYASGTLVKSRPDVVRRFVKSLVEAENFLKNNPDALNQVMKNTFHYSDAYIASVISKFKFFVALDQPMLILMEDEARWVIDNKLTNKKTLPNYLNLIYFDALESVAPQAITLIK